MCVREQCKGDDHNRECFQGCRKNKEKKYILISCWRAESTINQTICYQVGDYLGPLRYRFETANHKIK